MKVAVVITLLMYLVTMFDSSNSIKCYVCNIKGEKIHDPDCEIIDKSTSTYLNECPELGAKCGTIVTFGRQGEVESASRGCMEKTESERCEDLQHPYISCQTCETDECNSSSAFNIEQYKDDSYDAYNNNDDDDDDDDYTDNFDNSHFPYNRDEL